MKPNIYIDERERGEIREKLELFDCNLYFETLPIGDYIVSNQTGIERKRGDDLAASICDNRFFKQLFNLANSFNNPILLLEDFSRMFERNIERKAIFGALVYIQYKWKIKVYPTQNALESARIIWSLARFYQKGIDFEYHSPKLQECQISFQNQVDFLEGLLDVSQKKAKRLLKEFKSPGEIIQGIINTKIQKSSSGKSQSLIGPFDSIKGFGPKFIEKNQKLLTSRY